MSVFTTSYGWVDNILDCMIAVLVECEIGLLVCVVLVRLERKVGVDIVGVSA